MLEFELQDRPATLLAYKPGTEKFGGTEIPKTELVISCLLDADVLAFFEPTLESFLFNKNSIVDLAGDTMPLRDPHMVYPLKRDEAMTGATVLISYGIGDPMRLADSNVNTFLLTPMAGGRVAVDFHVDCKPTEAQAGKFYVLQKQPITITVEPPELKQMKAAA